MSFKPSRSSGIMFEQFDQKYTKYRNEVSRIISENEVIRFDQINYFSKCVYLSWQNDKKKDENLLGRGALRNEFSEFYCPDYYIRIFKRNLSLVYRPFQNTLSELN